MDAMDINWCLTCNRHIDLDGNAPYCSQECFASDRPSLFFPSPSPFRSPAHSISELFDAVDLAEPYHEDLTDLDDGLVPSAWIGRGEEGIYAWARDVTPGAPCDPDQQFHTQAFRPPKLLQSPRRPVPPTLSISDPPATIAEASQPIGTRSPPRKPSSAPSLVTLSTTNTSMTSLPTPRSSMFVATPADTPASHPPSLLTHDHPHAAQLMHKLTAHLRSWAANSSQKDSNTRSATITRTQRGDSTSRTGVPAANVNATSKPARRPRSPPCLFLSEDDSMFTQASKELSSCVEKEQADWSSMRPTTHENDHAVFRLRGRKVARVAS